MGGDRQLRRQLGDALRRPTVDQRLHARLTVNDVIAANALARPPHRRRAPSGWRRWWCPIARCRPMRWRSTTTSRSGWSACGCRCTEGFSKQLQRTVLRRHRRSRCTDYHGRHRCRCANAPDRRGIFPCRAQLLLHDLARQRKGVAGWRSGLGARTGVTFPMLAYPEPAVSGNVRFYFDRSPRAAPVAATSIRSIRRTLRR